MRGKKRIEVGVWKEGKGKRKEGDEEMNEDGGKSVRWKESRKTGN